ncbi:hypothetical protein [Streptomyces sp. HUAS ZL42]|uniref:hypothetical protein n=1 Tax=Streptomyces sp. HUAS ZL42 TaxID=3231715 RepID=UPI00345ECDB4
MDRATTVAAPAATNPHHADLSHASSRVVLFGYCLLATGSLPAMEIHATAAPGSARVRLGRIYRIHRMTS